MAVISAISSIVSGNKAAKAQERAAGDANELQRDNLELQREIFYQQRADQAPYRQVGANALAGLAFESGLAPSPYFSPNGLNAVDDEGNIEGVQYSQEGFAPAAAPAPAPAPEATPFPTPTDRFRFNNASIDGFNPNDLENSTYSPSPNELQQLKQFNSGPLGQSAAPAVPAAAAPAATAPAAAAQSGAPNGIAYQGFKATPGYQFRLDQGNRAIDNRLAAMGLSGSGAALKAAARFNQGIASDEYGNYINRLSALSGTGQTATNNVGAFASNYGQQATASTNQQAGNILAAGNARASAYQNTGNAINGAIGGAKQGLGFLMGGF